MSKPVRGAAVGAVFHQRGHRWSCSEDADGNGLHTGVDFPAAIGTAVVAARAGKIKHVDFGAEFFGDHQLVVLCDDGTQDFYAHMRSRTADARKVRVGDKIGEVGEEGNITGPHLHFERHKSQADLWRCDLPVNPGPSLHQAPHGMTLSRRILLSELTFGEANSNSVRRLQRALNLHRQGDDEIIRLTGDYGTETDRAVRICQQRHGFGDDLEGASAIGIGQARHLFGQTRRIVDDV